MKILLFILGSIESRILDWGLDGFKSLFEQDTILWGPIPDEKFIYEGKEIPILRLNEPASINDVFNKLPKDWYPDIVTCETSVLSYIQDIYLCPVKTILFSRDAWTDTIFNRNLVELFDFLNHSVIDRKVYNTFNVRLLPLSSFAVSTPENDSDLPDFERRKIDVIAIANYNTTFYHDRFKSYYNLASLNKNSLKIKYIRWIDRPEIHKYYQRSKVVIDWAHTLSNRSYEAALNGCLLFSHEDNILMKEFWIPWEEYIPYNDNNVFELLKFYLSNPDDSRKIISNAYDKIKSVPSSWGQFVWENINIAKETDISIKKRIEKNVAVPKPDLLYRSATPLMYNYRYNTNFPQDWREIFFDRIDDVISETKNGEIKNDALIEAIRVAYLLKKTHLCVDYSAELQKLMPDYAWLYYLQGKIYFEKGEDNKALNYLEKSIECGLKAPELLQEYILPFIEIGNSCDNRRIIDYMWQPVHNHDNEFQVKSFMHLAFELIGDIYRRSEDDKNSIAAYIQAISYLPVPTCIYKVNPLLQKLKEFEKLLEISERGIEDSPYESILVLYMAFALLNLNKRRKAVAVLKLHQKASKSFMGGRKLLFLRSSITAIILVAFLNKSLGSKAILEVIRILNN